MSNYVIAYEKDSRGYYEEKQYIVNDIENIAAFIAQLEPSSTGVITDSMDRLILKTSGIYLEEVADRSYLTSLLNYLTPFLQGNRRIPKVRYYKF